MKKISFLVLITAVLVSKVEAQQGFIEFFDSAFVNISKTQATTGVLYDRVLPFSNLTRFSGSNPDTAEMYRFLYGFHELYNAAFDTAKRLPFNGDTSPKPITQNHKNQINQSSDKKTNTAHNNLQNTMFNPQKNNF